MNKLTIALLVAAGALAHAEVDPVASSAIDLAKRTVPDAKQVGDVLAGAGDKTDWNVDLKPGTCYTFAAAAAPGVKHLSLYLWDPGGHRVADEKPKQPQVALSHCATVAGLFHVQAKAGPKGDYRMVIFAKGNAGNINVAQKGGGVAAPPPPPPPAASSLAPSMNCSDDGADGYGSMVVSCADCGAMGIWFDGQMQQVGQGATSWRIDAVSAGCHTLKVDAWTGLFKHTLWYDGKVKVMQNMEARYESRAGKFELVGKNKIAPPPPTLSADAVNDALDYVKEAIDYNNDEDSRCANKVGGKLESVNDLLGDLRGGHGDLDKTTRKLEDTIAFAEDECPKRVASGINKKLNKALDRLRRGN